MEEIGSLLDGTGFMVNDETFSSSYTYDSFDTDQDSMFAGLDFFDFASFAVDQNPDMINTVLSMPLSPNPIDECDTLDISSQLPIEDYSETVHAIGAETQLEQLLARKSTPKQRNRSTNPLTQSTNNYSSLNKLLQSKAVSSSTKSGHHKVTSTTSTKSNHKDNGHMEIKEHKIVDKTLKFPPCSICGGRASGLHYGVNSCEACKGFFRRYLTRNEEYKCSRSGECPIVNRNRENCSGCRLRRCLDLGMSKDKSKLGRYTLWRRTETIKKVNKFEGKMESDSLKEEKEMAHTTKRPANNKPIKSRKKSGGDELYDTLVGNLVQAMHDIKPFGHKITSFEDVIKTLKHHHDRYKRKTEVYGEMKSIPSEEYYKLLKQYGIDVDGRLESLRDYVHEAKRVVERYCNFAKLIPDFCSLSYKDQTNLLKASRCDFFLILMHEGYNHEYKILLTRSGKGYHVEEVSDKIFSRKLIAIVCNMYFRLQKLTLTKPEKALLIALTLVFTDRCNVENHELVGKIQLSLADMLRKQLEKTCKKTASQRFTKIIDCLVLMRETSELYQKEYKQLCKDEYVIQEVPTMKDFLMDDW